MDLLIDNPFLLSSERELGAGLLLIDEIGDTCDNLIPIGSLLWLSVILIRGGDMAR